MKFEDQNQSEAPSESFDPSADEGKLANEWYEHTSWEGRSPSEFEAMRKEVQAAEVIDFVLYQQDKDYRRFIDGDENTHLREFLAGSEVPLLMGLRECADQVGITSAQFEGLLAAFDPGAVASFKENLILKDLLRQGYQDTTSEERNTRHQSVIDRMTKTIEKLKQKDHPTESSGFLGNK